MDTEVLRALLLGILQGLTEFLPVSSSGHLVIVPELLTWPRPGMTFDAVAHAGTALAVLLYFRSDWLRLLTSPIRGLRAGNLRQDPDARLLGLLALSTLPAVVVSLALNQAFEELFARPLAAAPMLLVTGALLVIAEQLSSKDEGAGDLSAGRALTIGVSQALAIIPGISRSGSTIAAGQLVGLSREEATRFSFLLAGPITAGAGIFELTKSLVRGAVWGDLATLATGFVAAFLSGYLTIGFLLAYSRRAPLYVFAAYTWAFGLVAWWWLR